MLYISLLFFELSLINSEIIWFAYKNSNYYLEYLNRDHF